MNTTNIAAISVDSVEFKTNFKLDAMGYDLEFFGNDNEWSDGKHYAGLMSCLRLCFENDVKSVEIERKGSTYKVELSELGMGQTPDGVTWTKSGIRAAMVGM